MSNTVWGELQEEPGRAGSHSPTREAAVWPPESANGDGAGIDLSFFGGLAVTLGSLADTLKRTQDRRDALTAGVPQDYNPVQSGQVGSSGDLILDLGSVPEGRVWQVRRITIGAPTAISTPTGGAFAIGQGAPPVKGAIPTINVLDNFPTFTKGAAGSTYGTHQLFLIAPEHLWIVIHGATTGSQWVASARIEDFDADLYYQATLGTTE